VRIEIQRVLFSDDRRPGEVLPRCFIEVLGVRRVLGKKANWQGSANYKHSFTYTPDAGKATALLGNTEKTVEYLNAAVSHGWTNAGWTKGQDEFSILHNHPEWKAIISRMENAAKN